MRDTCDIPQTKNCLPDCKTEMQKFYFTQWDADKHARYSVMQIQLQWLRRLEELASGVNIKGIVIGCRVTSRQELLWPFFHPFNTCFACLRLGL